ncbi:dihydroneopterin aldolase [Tropicimonas marinistellae]|uniref:dihydroneopterin aldolase n=1 Tax=Tropicimonas marinistellae TaxID=1739787 RepID=UPI00082FB0B3|nr:dihydroneopterin aldolase [Tropicimonas marinistellae]
MNDQIRIEQVLPARAVPQQKRGSGHADRLLLRDYTRKAEIGAFGEERGVEQTLRFNLTVGLSPADAPTDDDVDSILSYDTLVQTVDFVLAQERLDLLETLAERIAQSLLGLPRVSDVWLRIEKLDRGPYSLGVEIERSEPAPEARGLPDPSARRQRPVIVMISDSAADDPRLGRWFEMFRSLARPVILTVGREVPQNGTRTPALQRQLDLLSLDRSAWLLASHGSDCSVVDNQTELHHVIESGTVAVWAPTRMVRKTLDTATWDGMSGATLTVWLAELLGAEEAYTIGPADLAGGLPALTEQVSLRG